MKILNQIILVLFLTNSFNLLHAANDDSLSYKRLNRKNVLEVQLLGNNYVSPFMKRYSLLSVNYSRIIVLSNSSFELTAGIGTFRSYYVETIGQQHIYHKPYAICLPAGFLWHLNNNRNGLAAGFFVTSAFVRQDYSVILSHSSSIDYTVKYDYELMPDLCYEVKSKGEKIICKLSYTPKFSSGFIGQKKGYEWRAMPLWFGLSIGGAW